MSIETLELALEALNELRGEWSPAFYEEEYDSDKPEENTRRTLVKSAITALHQVIEQAQKQEPVAYDAFKDWMMREMPPMTTIGNPEWWAKRIYERFIHTSPPQRQPLTDEQADQIIKGLRTCQHQTSKREFLKVWLRDWAAHGIKVEA